MDLNETKLRSEAVYDGKLLHVYRDTVRLPNGRETVREYLHHRGAVCVLPLTEKGEALMVRQFRYPFHGVLLEAPAGKIDAGEEAFHAAVRELSEETGAAASEWVPLGTFYPSVAYTDEVIYLYLARGLTFAEMHTDDDEFLEPVRIPLETLADMVMHGEIGDGKTQTIVLKSIQWIKEQHD